MIIKDKKFNKFFFIAFFFVITFLILLVNINKKLIQKEFYYLIDIVDTNLHKVTSFTELYGHHNIYDMGDSFLEIVKNIILSTPSVIMKIPDYLVAPKTDFEKIELSFDFQSYKQLLNDRESSIKYNVQTNNRKTVNGMLDVDGKKFKIDSTIKGKLMDHFRSPKRFSLKIDMKDDKYFKGMSEFSIQKLESRASPYEQIFLSIAKNLGFITPKHYFYEVKFNNSNWGVMNIEENVSKESLELNQFNGELIIQLGDDHNHFIQKKEYYVQPLDMRINLETFPMRFIDFKKIHEKNAFHIDKLRKLEFSKNLRDIFDLDKMCTLALMSLMWGDPHILEFNNSQYAYDKYKLKLEPIPQDVGIGPREIKSSENIPALPREYFNSCSNINISPLIEKIEIALLNSKNAIIELDRTFPLNDQNTFELLQKNISFIKRNISKDDLETIDNRFPIEKLKYSKDLLKDINILKHYIYYKDDKYYLKLSNLLRADVIIKEMYLNNQKIILNTKLSGIYFDSMNDYEENLKNLEHIVEIDKRLLNYNSNRLVFDLEIDQIEHKLIIHDIYSPINFNQNLSFNRINDYFKDSGEKYILKQGNWIFNEPIKLDKSLVINAGTSIDFLNNASLHVVGGLEMNGDINKKIKIFSTDKSWRGIFVDSQYGNDLSILKNVEIYNLNEFKNLNYQLNGGINFFHSDVVIRNVFIEDTLSEDVINFINSKFEVNDLIVNTASSDAIDSDYSVGDISNSIFSNIKGDAVDTSGSKVSIKKSIFRNIDDKSISAGEDSDVQISNILFDGCLICIASKDRSKVVVGDFELTNYDLFFGASYMKKPFYEIGGEIEFKNLPLNEIKNLKLARDINSKILIGGKKYVPEILTDFSIFYEDGTFN